MLPVVSTLAETKRQILLYTLVLVVFSASFAATGAVGWIYLIGSIALGGGFLIRAVRLARSDGIEEAKALYVFSIAYLALLFGVAIADSIAGRY